jgi:hypothetical protein
MLAFSFIIPVFASLDSEGEETKAEGTIQSVDATTASFTVLAEDGATVTVFAPEGFDLTLLVVGDHIEVEGTVGLDGLFAASELELQDGTEFEVDDEVEEEDGDLDDDEVDDLDEDEDDDLDEDEDDDLDEDEDDDEDEEQEDEGESEDDEDSGGDDSGDGESEEGDDD